jgi:hypothetical protein
MRILARSSEAEVILHWYRSECHRFPDCDPALYDFRVQDSQANGRRKGLLWGWRHWILNRLPENLAYFRVEVEEEDLEQLYIIPSRDWYVDTGRTFRLGDTLNHLEPGRWLQPTGEPREPIQHFDKVAKQKQYFADRPNHTGEFLILIGEGPLGPWTVIDGTHRATALLQLNKEHGPTLPWPAFLLTSEEMSSCFWHVPGMPQDYKDWLAREDADGHLG